MINKIKHFIKENYIFFLKFAIVGGSGTIINLVIFYFMADYFKINPILSSVVGFTVAVTNNYLLNHKWTFISVVNDNISLKYYLKFVTSSLLGLLMNIIVLKIVIIVFKPKLLVIAQAFGIVAGMGSNFLLSKFIVFKKK